MSLTVKVMVDIQTLLIKGSRVQLCAVISAGIVDDFWRSRIICYKQVELKLDSSKCTKLKIK